MKTLFYLSLTLATCRLYGQNPLLRHLPPDACSIYHFNLPVLRTKVSLQQLTERIPLPQQNTYNRELAAILREPGRAGIDTTLDLFLTESNGQGRDSLRTMSLLVHLVDSGRWSAFLREQVPGDRMGSAWDKDLAVLTFVSHIARSISPAGITRRAIRQSRRLLQGFDDSTCIRDSLFLAGLADDADIHAWTDQGRVLFLVLQQLLHLDHTPSYPALTAPGCGKVRTLSSLRFEKGLVLLRNTLCLPPGIDSLYARLMTQGANSDGLRSFPADPRPFSADLLSRIPSGTLLAMFNLRLDPAAIPGLLQGLQARGRSEALLFDKGVSLEAFQRGFKGDFLLTALQPPMVPDSVGAGGASAGSGTTPPRPTIYLAADLRDLSAFWSWTSHLEWLNPTADLTGAGRVSTHNPISKHLPAYRIQDSLLVIGGSARKVSLWFDPASPQKHGMSNTNLEAASPDTYPDAASKAYPPRNTDTAVITRFRESPLSGWIDLRALTASLRQRPSSQNNPSLLTLLSAMDMLTFTAGRLNNLGQVENTTELRLVNGGENSLKVLFRLLQ
ncbi:MAG TPA: hypothetical protein VL727_12580 [Puia sp.]|nr:hypothetical protein [Puia sp.]